VTVFQPEPENFDSLCADDIAALLNRIQTLL